MSCGVSVAGGQMKTTYGWYQGGNGTNSSGFSGLPGGQRDDNGGDFFDAGYGGYWWSSSPDGSGSLPNGSSVWYRYLDFNWEVSPASTTSTTRLICSLRSGCRVRQVNR